ncbi:hypothetical protein MMC29_006481 [Sticta canariensis]|nr:hypothetical protein [Sticta canariensis]
MSVRKAEAIHGYVAVLDNGELEGSGDWSAVSKSQINQTSPRCLVWGAVNKKDRMEYRFAATVHLQTFSPVSQALVGRIPWDHPSAVREAQVLLENDTTVARELLDAYSLASLKAFKKAYQEQKETEMQCFADRYCDLLEEGHKLRYPFDSARYKAYRLQINPFQA